MKLKRNKKPRREKIGLCKTINYEIGLLEGMDFETRVLDKPARQFRKETAFIKGKKNLYFLAN